MDVGRTRDYVKGVWVRRTYGRREGTRADGDGLESDVGADRNRITGRKSCATRGGVDNRVPRTNVGAGLDVTDDVYCLSTAHRKVEVNREGVRSRESWLRCADLYSRGIVHEAHVGDRCRLFCCEVNEDGVHVDAFRRARREREASELGVRGACDHGLITVTRCLRSGERGGGKRYCVARYVRCRNVNRGERYLALAVRLAGQEIYRHCSASGEC